MKKKELIQKIAQLESMNDQLISEIEYLDQITKQLGFTQGLTTLKAAAEELLEEQNDMQQEDETNPPLAG